MPNTETPARPPEYGGATGSTEPCRRAFSREEMIEEAKAYMRETWGPCRESEDRDKWHERLGMLVDFIHDRFPSNVPVRRGTPSPQVAGSACCGTCCHLAQPAPDASTRAKPVHCRKRTVPLPGEVACDEYEPSEDRKRRLAAFARECIRNSGGDPDAKPNNVLTVSGGRETTNAKH